MSKRVSNWLVGTNAGGDMMLLATFGLLMLGLITSLATYVAVRFTVPDPASAWLALLSWFAVLAATCWFIAALFN